VYLTIAILANAAASIALKLSTRTSTESLKIFGFSLTLWTISAALMYGVAFVMYAQSLRGMPLHVAHPLSTIVPVLIIAASSAIVFREHLSALTIVGFVLIATGAVFIGVKL